VPSRVKAEKESVGFARWRLGVRQAQRQLELEESGCPDPAAFECRWPRSCDLKSHHIATVVHAICRVQYLVVRVVHGRRQILPFFVGGLLLLGDCSNSQTISHHHLLVHQGQSREPRPMQLGCKGDWEMGHD